MFMLYFSKIPSINRVKAKILPQKNLKDEPPLYRNRLMIDSRLSQSLPQKTCLLVT